MLSARTRRSLTKRFESVCASEACLTEIENRYLDSGKRVRAKSSLSGLSVMRRPARLETTTLDHPTKEREDVRKCYIFNIVISRSRMWACAGSSLIALPYVATAVFVLFLL